MDAILVGLIVVICLYMCWTSFSEEGVYQSYIKYVRIGKKLREQQIQKESGSQLDTVPIYRLASNIISSYNYPLSIGANKFGCLNTDAQGNIYILKCGTGDACYFEVGADVTPNKFCQYIIDVKTTFASCKAIDSFSQPNSPCMLAYSQNYK